MTVQTETGGPQQISLEELGKLEVPYGRSKIFKAYKDANFLDRRDESIASFQTSPFGSCILCLAKSML